MNENEHLYSARDLLDQFQFRFKKYVSNRDPIKIGQLHRFHCEDIHSH